MTLNSGRATKARRRQLATLNARTETIATEPMFGILQSAVLPDAGVEGYHRANNFVAETHDRMPVIL